jgi:hypothetical protein
MPACSMEVSHLFSSDDALNKGRAYNENGGESNAIRDSRERKTRVTQSGRHGRIAYVGIYRNSDDHVKCHVDSLEL